MAGKTKERDYKDLEKWGDALSEDPIVDEDELETTILRVGHDIEEEISTQSATYGWWGVKEAQASIEVESYKLALDVYRAKKSKEIREEHRKEGDKLTEGKLENLLVSDDEHQRLEHKILDAKRNYATIAAVRKALEHKLQMIITYCANRRKEINP